MFGKIRILNFWNEIATTFNPHTSIAIEDVVKILHFYFLNSLSTTTTSTPTTTATTTTTANGLKLVT